MYVLQATKTFRVPLQRGENLNLVVQPQADNAYVFTEVGSVKVEEMEAVGGVPGRNAELAEDMWSADGVPFVRYQGSTGERVVFMSR